MISAIAPAEIPDIIYPSKREMEMTKLEKGRSGEFRIFHVGKMAYTVEFQGQVIGQFKSYGRARTFASERYYASKSEA